MARELHKHGLVESPEPKSIDIKEAGQLGRYLYTYLQSSDHLLTEGCFFGAVAS